MDSLLAWFNPTRWILLACLLVALVVGALALEKHIEGIGYDRAQTEYAKQAKAVDTTRAAVAPPIAAKHDEAVVKIQTVVKTIYKDRPIYVKATDCPLTPGFRVYHDAAANGVVPEPSGIPNAQAVPATDVADTVNANYGTCHETEQRLIDLQAWVRAQQALQLH